MSATTTPSLSYDPATVEFDPLLRRINLANTRRRWRELLERTETRGWSCREFLGVVITEEIAHRQQTRIQRSVRQARFPFLKTVEEFDFSFQSSVRLSSLGSYLGPELVSGGRSLVLQGRSGRGKTHLVIAIAYRAIQNGFTARFVTAAVLIESLSVASRQGRLQATRSLPAAARPGHRRGWLSLLWTGRRQRPVPHRQRTPSASPSDAVHYQQAAADYLG